MTWRFLNLIGLLPGACMPKTVVKTPKWMQGVRAVPAAEALDPATAWSGPYIMGFQVRM